MSRANEERKFVLLSVFYAQMHLLPVFIYPLFLAIIYEK